MDTVKSPAEQRILLENVAWATYESLLSGRGENRVPRFTYDRGMLEIMSPSSEHESVGYYIGLLVALYAEETGTDVYGVGSTTFRRADIQRGFEPDACFYVRNEERIRGKSRIDLDVDPPPDLVIEIDITSPSINKLPIYARLGVPEVWRYDGEKLEVLQREGDGYTRSAESGALPSLTASVLSGFVEESKSAKRTAWLKTVREWARELT